MAAIGDRTKVVDDLAAATAKAAELEKTANELKAQLEDLLKAKDDDERQLLEKFRDLLNEKKLKIRQQQRLLASAEVDPEKLQNVGASQTTLRKAKASRDGKRKATEEQEDDVSDDGFDKMDVDSSAKVKDESDSEAENHDEPEDHQTTEDELDDATASEADTDEEPQPAVKAKAKAKVKSPVRPTTTRKAGIASTSKSTRSKKSQAEASDTDEDEPENSPPRRNLPVQARKQSPAAKAADNDDMETDDEL